uniref:Uncharacterized protein n=1 Tax=Mastacembelus armatus TaxID=205130 RepID=A0A7N8YIX0_9TELE
MFYWWTTFQNSLMWITAQTVKKLWYKATDKHLALLDYRTPIEQPRNNLISEKVQQKQTWLVTEP